MTSARRPLAIALSALVVAVGGLAPAAATAPAEPSLARAATEPPPALAPFYAQSLEWRPCDAAKECAWLTVPRDYSAPQDATIQIRVSRMPAAGGPAVRVGSLVVNPGGPGASGLDFAAVVSGLLGAEVAAVYDVVGFDPRGVGQSAPITCLTGRQTTRWLRTDLSPDSAAERRQIMSRSREIARGCLQRTPEMARHVGTGETVQDLDILRAALGSERLNLLGYSYGTYLGTLYAERFPEAVGRFVLDGAVDPSLDVMEISEGQSAGFQRAMTRFAQDCAPRPTCAWRGSAAKVLAGINRLTARLERNPLPTDSGLPLVQAEAVTAMFFSMYTPLLWPALRGALAQAERGDGLALQQLADYAADRTGPNRYASNMASAFTAISCWDSPAPPRSPGLTAAARSWARDAKVPVMAETMSWGNAPCSVWFGHSGRVPAPARTTTTSPILVVGTTYDPATPYSWATALHDQLPTSGLLTFRGDGHTAFGNGSRCIDAAVNGYLLTGVLPTAGTVCR